MSLEEHVGLSINKDIHYSRSSSCIIVINFSLLYGDFYASQIYNASMIIEHAACAGNLIELYHTHVGAWL